MRKPLISTYRRHVKTCPHRRKGQGYTHCDCPIWAYGHLQDGTSIRESTGTTKPEIANRWAEHRMNGTACDIVKVHGTGVPFEVAAAAYLRSCEDNKLAENSVISFRKTLKYFGSSTAAAGKTVADIDLLVIDQYRHERRHLKANTLRKELVSLSMFFKWAKQRKYTAENPLTDMKLPAEPKLVTKPFNDVEVEKILQGCSQITSDRFAQNTYYRKRARAITLVMLDAGLRVSDVAALRTDALNRKTGYLTVQMEKTDIVIKLLLSDRLRLALETLPVEHPDYFFWSGKGKVGSCATSIRTTFRRLGRNVKIENVHPHRFRDTFAARLLSRGVSIYHVSKLLGHSSVVTTEKHYGHFVPEAQKLLDNAISLLDNDAPGTAPILMHTGRNRRRNA